jgi:dephospho-CoA kinase
MAKLRVALTGGIGSGKSAVAAVFAERGATVIDADVLAREVVAPHSEGLREIAELWPEAIGPDGALNRPAMAQIVFGDENARARLNGITHPRVRALAAEREAAAPAGVIVHVIPLLFEGEAWRGFEKTVLVTAPAEARIARVIARDATDRDTVERRMAAQIAPELARARAGYVIENDGDLAALREQSMRCYDALQRDLAAKEDTA